MTKKSSSKKPALTKQQAKTQRIAAGAVMVVFVLLAGYYAISGKDPLGLFVPEDTTPVTVPDTVGSGGDWWRVYFTDPKRLSDSRDLRGSVPEKLIALIDAAEESIHIASFEFNLTPVAEALITAHKRGVDVKWVTDDEHGIEAEVIDPRTLVPFDKATVVESVCKTGRLVIVHEAVRRSGFGAEIAASVAESEAFGYLQAPIARVANPGVPVPHGSALHQYALPGKEDIVAAVRRVMSYG